MPLHPRRAKGHDVHRGGRGEPWLYLGALLSFRVTNNMPEGMKHVRRACERGHLGRTHESLVADGPPVL